LSHSKPDVTLITPSLHSNSPLKPGKSLGNLANEIDFDETTFVVKQANQKSVLPAWAKDHGSVCIVIPCNICSLLKVELVFKDFKLSACLILIYI